MVETGEYDATVENVIAMPIDETELQKELEGISQRGQVVPQGSSGSISDIQLADEPGIMQASAVEVVPSFAVPVELPLEETDPCQCEMSCTKKETSSGSLLPVVSMMQSTITSLIHCKSR